MTKTIKSFAALLLFAAAVFGGYLLSGPLSEMDQKGEAEKPLLPYTRPDREKLEEIGLQPFESLLPVVHIDTDGARITRENRVQAVLALQNEGDAHENYPSCTGRPDAGCLRLGGDCRVGIAGFPVPGATERKAGQPSR